MSFAESESNHHTRARARLLAHAAHQRISAPRSKALLSTEPLRWSLGFHTCEEEVCRDDELILLHLHKYDLQAYLQRHTERAQMRHSEEAVRNEWNRHYRTTGPALMMQYMSTPAPLEEIPEWVRTACDGV